MGLESRASAGSFSEECWFIHGIKIGGFYFGRLKYHSIGSWGAVDFDWEKALKSKTLIGWYHSHPSGIGASPSTKDHRTMRSWVRSIDKPLICGFFCDGDQASFLFYQRKGEIVYSKLYSHLRGRFYMGFIDGGLGQVNMLSEAHSGIEE